MPHLACTLETAQKNKLLWDTHQETEQEKLVYVKAEDLNKNEKISKESGSDSDSNSDSENETKGNMLKSLAEDEKEYEHNE
jgi:hypothetical protein